MSEIKIKNNPIPVLFKAFRELWPDAKMEIQFSDDMPQATIDDIDESINKDDVAEIFAIGATKFEDGKVPLVLLSYRLIDELAATLTEELVHVAVGIDAGHGQVFKEALEKLHNKFIILAEREADNGQKE